MAYVPHLRVTMSGTLGPLQAPVEDFSFGFQLGRGAGGVPGKQALVDLANSIHSYYATTLALIIKPQAVLTRVRVSDIATTGRTVRAADGSYNHGDSLQITAGQNAGAQHPPQVALAVGLYSELDDLTGRGRFYLPLPGLTLQPDMRITPADAAGVALQVRDFLVGAQAASQAGGFGGIVLASQGSVSRGIPAANRPITEIQVGRVLDTMRSRRAQLLEEPAVRVFP